MQNLKKPRNINYTKPDQAYPSEQKAHLAFPLLIFLKLSFIPIYKMTIMKHKVH